MKLCFMSKRESSKYDRSRERIFGKFRFAYLQWNAYLSFESGKVFLNHD